MSVEFAGSAAASHSNSEAVLEEANREASADDTAGADIRHTGDRQS